MQKSWMENESGTNESDLKETDSFRTADPVLDRSSSSYYSSTVDLLGLHRKLQDHLLKNPKDLWHQTSYLMMIFLRSQALTSSIRTTIHHGRRSSWTMIYWHRSKKKTTSADQPGTLDVPTRPIEAISKKDGAWISAFDRRWPKKETFFGSSRDIYPYAGDPQGLGIEIKSWMTYEQAQRILGETFESLASPMH